MVISSLLDNNLITSLLKSPTTSPVHKVLIIWLFSPLLRTIGDSMKGPFFWIRRHMCFLNFPLDIETILRICFFHGFWMIYFLFVDVWYLLVTPQAVYYRRFFSFLELEGVLTLLLFTMELWFLGPIWLLGTLSWGLGLLLSLLLGLSFKEISP